jgi:hypothetical protein
MEHTQLDDDYWLTCNWRSYLILFDGLATPPEVPDFFILRTWLRQGET